MNDHPTPVPPSLRIGPNAELTTRGLEVDGQPQPLRHREDFATVVRATSAAVAHILAQLFSVAVAVPAARGTVVASSLQAWEHYNQHALAIQALPADSEDYPCLGQVLLQWCVAALVVAEASHPAIGRAPEFLAVRFLANEGPAALAYTSTSWQAYREWLAWSESGAGAHARMTGDGERKSARRAPVSIIAPWPEALGADMGGPEKLAQHLSRLASDIITREDETVFRFHKHLVRVEFGQVLLDLFNEAAKEVPLEAPTVQRCFDWSVGGRRMMVRAQRTRTGKRALHVFRLLPTEMPDLTAFLPAGSGGPCCGPEV